MPRSMIDDQTLGELKAELERFGAENDISVQEHSLRMLNITHDTGEFLSVIVRAAAARRILEIGTSNGYSTLWLAEAMSATGGSVTTVEASEYKVGLAAANFERSGLAQFITLLHADAGTVLRQSREHAFDFIFLDTDRSKYLGWWPHLRRVLRPGGLLVADNAVSHAEEMAPFISMVKGDPAFNTSLVSVGNGEFMAVKASNR